jgi:hypothetical protein
LARLRHGETRLSFGVAQVKATGARPGVRDVSAAPLLPLGASSLVAAQTFSLILGG